MNPQPLTPKEKNVLNYIEGYISKLGIAPTFTEIKQHFGFASYNSVQRYLKQLQRKNYIHMPGGNQKRAITLLNKADTIQNSLNDLSKNNQVAYQTKPTLKKETPSNLPISGGESLSIPLLGAVAAGVPIEAIKHDEYIAAPLSLVKKPESTFALTVEGDSMIEDGIFDGDTILVEQRSTANSGDTIVAVVDNEATVKRIFFPKDKTGKIELRPANSNMKSLFYPAEKVEIKGSLSGLIRKYF